MTYGDAPKGKKPAKAKKASSKESGYNKPLEGRVTISVGNCCSITLLI